MMDRCQFQGCENDSEYGAHGIRDKQVYSEYWCARHFKEQQREVEMQEESNVFSLIRSVALDVSKTGTRSL